MEIDETILDQLGFEVLAGRLSEENETDNEVAISYFTLNQ